MDKEQKGSPDEFNQYLEKTLVLLSEVLHNVDNKPINPDIPLDKVMGELLQIEKTLDEFLDLNKELLEKSKEESVNVPIKSKEQARLLKKTASLQEAATKKRAWLAERKAYEMKKSKTATDDKTIEKAPPKDVSQKKKFSRMSRKKNWKPL